MKYFRERRPGQGIELCVHRFVDDAAPRSGVTIVLIHGFRDSGATWDLVARELVPLGHDLYAPDMRGFGGSDRVLGGGYYHFPDYVADLRRLVDHIAPRRLVLAGHSMGGTVAALYAGAMPDRVHRLVLLEGVGPPATEPNATVSRVRRWLSDLDRPRESRPLASLEDAAARLGRIHAGIEPALLASRARLLTIDDGDGMIRWLDDPLHRSTSPSRFDAQQFKAFLAEIRCPVLFVGGGSGGWHPADEDDRLSALPSPPARIDLEGAGHMMHWTKPEAVARAIAAFVTEP